MLDSPVRQTGCFVVKFPSTTWQQVPCQPVTAGPMAPSTQATIQPFAGNGGGNDPIDPIVANSPKTIIGKAQGAFPITSGITYESNNNLLLNAYSLQINSNQFGPIVTYYTDYKSTTGWEQFAYNSVSGEVFMEYWLKGYYATYHQCPTNTIANEVWRIDGGDCWENDNGGYSQKVPATELGQLVLTAYADYLESGNDQVILCINKKDCTANSWVDTMLDLYQNWVGTSGGGTVQFNVFGDCCGNQANFNLGTSIQVSTSLWDENEKPITPVCARGGTTAEGNNLNWGIYGSKGWNRCKVKQNEMTYLEDNLPHDTMTVSYSTPGGAGSSSAPIFKYVDETNTAVTYTLTNTPTALWLDDGKKWSVTPNPLVASGSTERWMSGQTLKGTSATETLNFAFYHQYLQTLSYSVVGGGSPNPPSFTANQFGASTPQVLTTTATGYWYDYCCGPTWSELWSVTNPLGGSSASEQWVTSQATGQITSAQTIAFAYQHQYYLTMKVNVSYDGSVTPSSGWYNVGAQVSIQAVPAKGYRFLWWTGTGAGSYTGSTNPTTITMNAAITEMAIFNQYYG